MTLAAVRWQDAGDAERGASDRGAPVAGPPSDAALLGRRGRDAQEGLGEVMRRHAGPLYAIAYRRLTSAADAEEVVQDAFLLLWRKRGAVRLVGDSALPWLIVTVKHLAANRWRATIRRRQAERAAEPAPAPDGSEEAADLLERAFAALAPLDAEIARLCLAEDLTYADAGALLGVSEGVVRNRLSRARARLRRSLEADR